MDDELKRLKRFIYVSWSLLLIIIIGLTFWGSVELRKLNSIILAGSNAKIIKGIDGKDGANGVAGINGLNGVNGQSGQNITTDQIAAAVSAYLTLNPPAQGIAGVSGDSGINGTDGLTLQIQVTNSCQIQTKYTTSDVWTPLAQLPLPCGLTL